MSTANFYILAKPLQSDEGIKEQSRLATRQLSVARPKAETVRLGMLAVSAVVLAALVFAVLVPDRQPELPAETLDHRLIVAPGIEPVLQQHVHLSRAKGFPDSWEKAPARPESDRSAASSVCVPSPVGGSLTGCSPVRLLRLLLHPVGMQEDHYVSSRRRRPTPTHG
jgi:hypothetical protein